MIIAVKGMKALGDCLFQRPYIRLLSETYEEVYLGTPWPQLYSDLTNVRPCRVETRRFIALRNLDDYDGAWHQFPKKADREIKVHNVDGTPVRIGESFDVMKPLPPECPPINVVRFRRRPIAVVRPPALRPDWDTENREPHWQYLYDAAQALMSTHHVILAGGPGEEIIGTRPPNHESFLGGTLSFDAFMTMMASADVIVAGIGSMVPLAIALRKKALIVLGGRGGTCGVESVCAPHWRHQIKFVHPYPYCGCSDPNHNCNKIIPTFAAHLEEFLSRHEPPIHPASRN